MAQRVDEFPADARPIQRPRYILDPLVIEAVEAELWDSAYPGDNANRRMLAIDILMAIQGAQRA